MRASESFRYWFSARQLREIFLLEVKNKPTVGIDRVTVSKFQESLDDNVNAVSKKVRNGSFRFTNYCQLLVNKGLGKAPRELCIPTVRDKMVLKALSHVLDDVFGSECNTPQPQTVVDKIDKAIQSGTYTHFAKFDISRFYGSINHEILMRKLRSKVRKKEILALLNSTISTPSVVFGQRSRTLRKKGIPEGLPVSNRLANIYLGGLETALAGCGDIVFFRYVDDILLLGSEQGISSAERKLLKYFKQMDLETNEKKYSKGSLSEMKFDFLGYAFDKGRLNVGTRAKRNIESTLERLLSMGKSMDTKAWVWKFNLKVTGCRITYGDQKYKRFGWLYYYSRQTDTAYLGKLDSLVRKLAKRNGFELPANIKSFKKTYYEMKYHEGNNSYIPTIDMNMSIQDMRKFLEEKFGISNDDYSDEKVSDLFFKFVNRDIRGMERDVGFIS